MGAVFGDGKIARCHRDDEGVFLQQVSRGVDVFFRAVRARGRCAHAQGFVPRVLGNRREFGQGDSQVAFVAKTFGDADGK